ncbi:hypothetical protein KIH79_10675 [Bifidobacterium sp. 82T10]|uniref:XRE family transcriptional regulator n=1 Tax=Bifidobacterium miconis TaxID=2834435 RepID=A0ABS6WH35_9BIFI|nr:hypothetical protein [Bifidobacterium miconis]MBW3093374.1 hypothetical protein [Bifidobacterium miconis]
MATNGREWTELDRELMRLIGEAWDGRDPRPSNRAVAKAIGVTHPRVADLMAGLHGTPTVDEYCNLCILFGLDPGRTLNEALRAVA